MLSDRLSDPDLWWHLKTGGLIARTHHIPRTDIYSYTVPGRRWVPQEWGSELFLHGLRDAFGLYGILYWRAGMLLLLYALVAWLIVRRMGVSLGAWALVALTAYAGSSNWTERPNLFSFVFFAVFLHLIERRNRSIWLVVPIAALWANMHGMVILGVGLLGLVTLTEALKIRLGLPGSGVEWTKRIALATVAALGATFLNPWGPGLLIHAIELVRSVSNVVTEWFSPNFHEASSMIFLALFLITIASIALSRVRVDITDLALVVVFGFMALQAARNLAVASIVLGYVAAKYLPLIAEKPREKVRTGEAPSVVLGIVAIIVTMVALVIVSASGFPRSNRPQDIVDKTYPIAAIETLDQDGIRLFTQDAWAGYVIDRAWPRVRVFYDTRVDLYGSDRAIRYARVIAAYPEWSRTLDASCTTHVLIRPREPLARVLALTPEWRMVRQDALSVIFSRVAPTPECGADGTGEPD
jgi:hypothetical protein